MTSWLTLSFYWLRNLFSRFFRRIPVILQLNEVECGAACLAMILSYFGRKTAAAECRSLLDISRDGVSAQAIAREARNFGLTVHAFSIEPSDLPLVSLPAIIFWEFNHFVILERWSAQSASIVDPAIGRRSLAHPEFDAGFTGVVLTFSPGVNFQPKHRAKRRSWWGYFANALFNHRGLLLQVLGASLLVQALGLVSPLFTQLLIDQILPTRNLDLLTLLGIGVLILTAAHAIFSFIRALVLLNLQARLDAQLMSSFLEHMLQLPFAFFQQRSSGDLLLRLRSNTRLRDTLTGETFSLILDSVLVATYLGVLLWRQPTLAILALIFGGAQVAILLGSIKVQRQQTATVLAAEATEHSYLVEMLKGVATLKASGNEERALTTWQNLFYASLNATTQNSFTAAVIDNGRWLIRALAPLALLWVGVRQVMLGTLNLGEMLALNQLAVLFLSPLSSLVYSAQKLQLAGAHLDRLADVLEAEPEQVGETVPSSGSLQGQIELKNVSFRYHMDAPYVLRDISLTIRPGQKVAIVGRSGSGKSTLAHLLLRLYQPTSGDIFYNGVTTQRLDVQLLRRQFGVVLQEPFLFSGSIRQNIALHVPDLSLDKIHQVAQIAAIHEEIEAMPMGYETRVAEDASTLSGGQRQRLALARALTTSPAILLLDEATSHLDPLTEQELEANLNQLCCTRIVIAHRLSTVRNADIIVVLDRGGIMECGTHGALMAGNGYYAALSQGLEEHPPEFA